VSENVLSSTVETLADVLGLWMITNFFDSGSAARFHAVLDAATKESKLTMSMVLTNTSRSIRRPNPWYASSLGRYVQQRRIDLGMTVAEAAELSGMEICQWAALETGWIPEDRNLLCSVAATLEVMNEQITLLASIARHNQPLVA